jgi:hypothetical protein
MESERALRCIRTEMTNKVTNLGVYYKLPCECTLKNYNNGYIEKSMVECFVKHSLPFYPGLAAKQ